MNKLKISKKSIRHFLPLIIIISIYLFLLIFALICSNEKISIRKACGIIYDRVHWSINRQDFYDISNYINELQRDGYTTHYHYSNNIVNNPDKKLDIRVEYDSGEIEYKVKIPENIEKKINSLNIWTINGVIRDNICYISYDLYNTGGVFLHYNSYPENASEITDDDGHGHIVLDDNWVLYFTRDKS